MAAATARAEPPPDIPAIPPATLDDSLEVTGEDLAAQTLRSRMFVEARINGQGPYRFLVDSGADRSVIGLGVATRLRLPSAGSATLQGMAGSSEVRLVGVDRLTIGSSDIAGLEAPVLPERYLGAHGVIGIDALADQRLMLDFEKKTVTVQDSRRPVIAEQGDIVVTARRRRGQLILTEATVGDRPVYAVIDTGADITVGNLALYRRIFGARRPPGTTVQLISVTGQVLTADLVVLPQIKIGRITSLGVQVAFVDAPPFTLFSLSRQPALLLGTDLLQVFRRVSLDFRHRRVRFTLRR